MNVWPDSPPPYIAGGDLTPEEIDAILGGTAPTSRPPTTGPQYLSQLVNQLVLDEQGNIGYLQTTLRSHGRRYYSLISPDGQHIRNIDQGAQIYEPNANILFTVRGRRVDNKGNILPERDYFIAGTNLTEKERSRYLGQFGEGGGAGGGQSADAAAQNASQERINAARIAADQELERLREAHAIELERMQEENALKRAKLSEAGGLARQVYDVQQRTRNLIAQLTGVDPVAATIAGQGGMTKGVTPAQGFMNANQAFVNTPIPQISENTSIPDLDTIIANLNKQTQAPMAPTGIGFAEGGTIDMTQGSDGVFSMAPQQPQQQLPQPMVGAPAGQSLVGPQPGVQEGTTKRAVLVGEKGSPPVAPGTEVMILDTANPGRTEVIPLVSGAQEGGTYDFGPIMQALAPLYAKLGLGGVPQRVDLGGAGFGFSPGTTYGGQQFGGSQILKRLGYSPQLIRDINSGTTYYRNRAGQLMNIPGEEAFQKAGFKWSNVLNVAPNEINEFGPWGGTFTGEDQIQPSRQYPQRVQPLFSPPAWGNIPLPDPRELAGIYRFLDPSTKTLLFSLYTHASPAGLGVDPQATQAALEQQIGFYTPKGTASQAGARFG